LLQENTIDEFDKNNPAVSVGITEKIKKQRIYGAVQDHTGHNLSDAKITLYVNKKIPVVSKPNTTNTDSQGMFVIDDAPENAKLVYVEHDLYLPEFCEIIPNKYFYCQLSQINYQSLCEKSGGVWKRNKCKCDEKNGMFYNNDTYRCSLPDVVGLEQRTLQLGDEQEAILKRDMVLVKSDDAITMTNVTVVDFYNPNKKIKGQVVCYENDGSCIETSKEGKVFFTQYHLVTETVTPIISVKPSDEYHCDAPIDINKISAELQNKLILGTELSDLKTDAEFEYLVRCKKRCTAKDLKKLHKVTECYQKGDGEYEVLKCTDGYRPTQNKDRCIEINDDVQEEEIEISDAEQCKNSGGTWNGKKCDCDKHSRLKYVKELNLCECDSSEMLYSVQLKKCVLLSEKCVETGGTWENNTCLCDAGKDLIYDDLLKVCVPWRGDVSLEDLKIYAPEKEPNFSIKDDDNPFIIRDGVIVSDIVNKREISKQKIVDSVSVLNNIKLKMDVSVWKNEDGKFNTARLASDAAAGVVLGTAGGLISNKLIKKSQIKKGFEGIGCYVAGQEVADYGDQFTVGLR
jgi:hypothetical protein